MGRTVVRPVSRGMARWCRPAVVPPCRVDGAVRAGAAVLLVGGLTGVLLAVVGAALAGPAQAASPEPRQGGVVVTPQTASPGESVAVQAGGFDPGTEVRVLLVSPRPLQREGRLVATLTAGAEGAVGGVVRLPRQTVPGVHTLTLAGQAPGANPRWLRATVIVARGGEGGGQGAATGGDPRALTLTGALAGTALLAGLGLLLYAVVVTRPRHPA